MSIIKEIRRQVIESGSPLRKHSLNQKSIKRSTQGEAKLRAITPKVFNQTSETTTSLQEAAQKLLCEDLPLTQEFLETMLPSMVEIAAKRIAEEEEKLTPVPVRIFRLVTDIQRIYRIAEAKDLHLQLIDFDQFKDPNDPAKAHYPTRRDYTRYPDLFDSMSSFKVLGKTTENPTEALRTVHRAILINLTSPDFTLALPDQIVDRVKVYSDLLANIAISAHAPDPNLYTARLKTAFRVYLEQLKAPLLKM